MPYRREFEPVLRRPIASQESIPSSAYWRQRALDLEDQAKYAAKVQEELDQDWMRYYYPAADAMRRKEMYSKRPRDWSNEDIEELAFDRVNNSMEYIPEYNPNDRRNFVEPSYEEPDMYDRYVNALAGLRYEDTLVPHSLEPAEQQSKLNAFLFGYNPNGGGEDFGWKDAAEMGVYAAPVVGNAYYASEMIDRIKNGEVPGLLEGALALPIARHVLKRAPKYLRGLKNFRAQQEARRAFERELDKRALTMPKPNKKVLEQGTFPWSRSKMVDRYVDPNMKFAPYEEVRF